MTFAQRFQKPEVDTSFLMNDMYMNLYKFLLDNGGIPREAEIRDMEERALSVIGYQPEQNDIFTAYKSILFGMILANLYPWDHSGSANIYLDKYTAIHQIYESRNIAQPSEEQLAAIGKELHRVADGYAKAVTSEWIRKANIHDKPR